MNKTIGWASGSGLLLVLLAGALAHFLFRTSPPGIDRAATEWLAGHRVDWLTTTSLVLNSVGGGLLGDLAVPGVIVIAFLLARRWRSAVVFVAAILVSAAVVQLAKSIVQRVRPADGLLALNSWSFPSGHAAHAATIAAVVALLTWRWWVAGLGAIYAAAMAFSRVYLGVHWLTDVVAGIVLGASIAGMVWFASRRLRPAQVAARGLSN